MSSRALRKVQKQRELEQLQSKQQQSEDEETEGDDDFTPTSTQKSAFALLNEQNEDDEEEANDGNDDDDEDHDKANGRDANSDDAGTRSEDDAPTQPKTYKPSRKKKKKKKGKSGASAASDVRGTADIDDIDAALKSLSAEDKTKKPYAADASIEDAVAEICRILTIDTHHLNVENEMKRLFGKAALEVEREEAEAARQRPREGEQVSLSEAVKGRNCYGGAGIPEVMRKRNPFIRGREDWPKTTGSGLGMEVVERRAGGIVEYRFTHNAQYQSSQAEFLNCVNLMDPMLMVNLLRFNPYHVSTLLQVSEIAKQEKDYSTAGELLERALFSFGRAVHSSFASTIAQGKARLDFRRPENREFYLTAWRYIGNVGMRSTWRTGLEWSKLLLSLNPEEDPYDIKLVIDQFSLRAHQPQTLLDLYGSKLLHSTWENYPNLSFSRCLAMRAVAKNPVATETAASELVKSTERYPYITAKLLQDRGVSKIPPSVWGKQPPSESSEFYTTFYTTLASDLWTPEAPLTFLTEAAKSARQTDESDSASLPEISLATARLTYLTDRPPLIALLPRSLTSKLDSSLANDPLPPLESLASYTPSINNRSSASASDADFHPEELLDTDPTEFFRRWESLRNTFQPLIDTVGAAFRQENGENAGQPNPEQLQRAEATIDVQIRQLGLSMPEVQRRFRLLDRMRTLIGSLSQERIDGVEDPLLRDAFIRQRQEIQSVYGRGAAGAMHAAPTDEDESDEEDGERNVGVMPGGWTE